MNVRRAQLDGILQNWLTKRMIEASSSSASSRWCPRIIVNDLESLFLVERANRVRADAEAFFNSRWMASLEPGRA